jgi:drug/metabolite transporter (DMT)-like permease
MAHEICRKFCATFKKTESKNRGRQFLRNLQIDAQPTDSESDAARGGLSTLGLYAVTVLIWGSTWLAITYQLGVVPPAVSIAWRFGIAGAVLLSYALWKGLPLRFGWRDHAWLLLEALTMFGVNYIFVYAAEQYLTSGLVAVTFSLMAFLNLAFMRLFYGTRIRLRDAAAAIIGITGIVLVFSPEVSRFSLAGSGSIGMLYALAAVSVASVGNIVSVRNQRARMPIVQVHAWAMLYAAVGVALYALIIGERFVFDWSYPYVVSLLYLALLGSAVAFGTYVTLMGRIGAGRAGYVSVAVPVVAVLVSTVFEGLQWQFAMVIGVALCATGNWLVLSPRRPQNGTEHAVSARVKPADAFE